MQAKWLTGSIWIHLKTRSVHIWYFFKVPIERLTLLTEYFTKNYPKRFKKKKKSKDLLTDWMFSQVDWVWLNIYDTRCLVESSRLSHNARAHAFDMLVKLNIRKSNQIMSKTPAVYFEFVRGDWHIHFCV